MALRRFLRLAPKVMLGLLLVAGVGVPLLALPARAVNLVLLVHTAAGREVIGGVQQLAVVAQSRMASARTPFQSYSVRRSVTRTAPWDRALCPITKAILLMGCSNEKAPHGGGAVGNRVRPVREEIRASPNYCWAKWC